MDLVLKPGKKRILFCILSLDVVILRFGKYIAIKYDDDNDDNLLTQ